MWEPKPLASHCSRSRHRFGSRPLQRLLALRLRELIKEHQGRPRKNYNFLVFLVLHQNIWLPFWITFMFLSETVSFWDFQHGGSDSISFCGFASLSGHTVLALVRFLFMLSSNSEHPHLVDGFFHLPVAIPTLGFTFSPPVPTSRTMLASSLYSLSQIPFRWNAQFVRIKVRVKKKL